MPDQTNIGLSLRERAIGLRRDVVERVNALQSGVPTFFDGYALRLLDHLISTEATHGWIDPGDARGDPEKGKLAVEMGLARQLVSKFGRDRFETYAQRRAVSGPERCEVGAFELLMSQGVAACLQWNGRPLFKTVYDFAIVPMLLNELQPGTIFELGSGTGASALWMADLCRAIGLGTYIHSVDINRVRPAVAERVIFHLGDASDPDSLFPRAILLSAPRPWIVIEDAHVNVPGVFQYFDDLLVAGDYFFVEDSRDKHHHLEDIVSDRYRVDSRYTDFFGRNATSAEDSIFRVCG